MAETTIALSRTDLEKLVRRVVREELRRLIETRRTVSGDPLHEGPSDASQDQILLVEALDRLAEYGTDPDAWLDWDTVKAEIARAEAAGELSR